MAIVPVNLGSAPTGAGGDTNREAFTKLNTSVSELAAAGGPAPVDLADVASGSPLALTIANDDANKMFWAHGASTYEITIPNTLPVGTQIAFVGFTTGTVTLDYSGFTVSGSHFPATEVVFDNEPFAVTVLIAETSLAAPLIILNGGTARLNTITTVYDTGWVAARPYAATVLAIGGAAAPGWLTSADVWFEDVS